MSIEKFEEIQQIKGDQRTFSTLLIKLLKILKKV